MAGRGTDIVLGGNVDFLTDLRLRARGLDPVETPDEYEAAWHEELPKVKEEAGTEATEVIEAGGLYVLGTERHESRRIDNQLRGRSGRQGDPGESRFYLSLGDELMRRFNGAALETLLTRLNLPDDVPIEAKMVTRAIKSAQTQVEQQNFEVRKNVLKYDEVMNQQRKVIYAERRRILEGENLQQQAPDMLVDVITAYVNGATAEGYAEDWDLDALWTALKTLYPVGISHETLTRPDADSERTTSPARSCSTRWSKTPNALMPQGKPNSRNSPARVRCASWNATCCSTSSTASGASTSTRWTTSRRASGCARWRSAIRWSSTSARATTCSWPCSTA